MLFSVEQAFVGREEIRAPLKTPAWEAKKSLACIAGPWKKEGVHKRETCSLSPRMSLSRTPVLSCTHYFQVPAKQFKKSQNLQSTLAFSCLAIRQRKTKTSQHNSLPLIFTLSIMLTKKKWLNCQYKHSKGLGFCLKRLVYCYLSTKLCISKNR